MNPLLAKRGVIPLAVLTCLSLHGTSAWSQAAPTAERAASAAPAPASGSSAPAVSDPAAPQSVTVTGNGRSQVLQSVPIALQLVTGEQITKLAASNLGDMNGYIPGLQVNAEQPTQSTFYLRGIGTQDFGIGTDSPVGVYVDGAYTGKTGGALMNFNDVKRIEVLKGPQGTLFGRNSAGGAISIVTNDPTGVFETSGLARFGSYGSKHFEGMVNDPLNEDFSLRISATGNFNDGWQRNDATGLLARREHAWGTRAALRWAASDETEAQLTWSHEDLNEPALPTIGLLATPQFDADPSVYLDPRKTPLLNDAPDSVEKRRFDGLTLHVDHDFGWADFTSTTSWRHFNTFNRMDTDGTGVESAYLSTANLEGNSTIEQEFKLSGHNATIDWVGGGSLFFEQARQTSEINLNTDSLDTLFGNVAGVMPYSTINQLAQASGIQGIDVSRLPWQENMNNVGHYRAFALYGDAIWHLTPSTNLTTGVRVTRDQKRFTWYNPLRTASALDAQLNALNAAGFYPGLVAAGDLSQSDADTLQALTTTNQIISGQGDTTQPLQVRKSWNNVSPRVVIDQHLGADAMVYASATRGYQAGGFNVLQPNGTYEPETVTSFELGAKGQVRSIGLTYSAALFHYAYNNLQSLTLVPSTGQSPISTYAISSSDEKASGLDLDLRWRATPHFTFYSSAEFIDQRYKDYLANDGTDLSGQPVGTPNVSGTLGADTTWPLAGGTAIATLQGAFTGPARCNADAAAQGTCLSAGKFRFGESTTRLDARIGWDRPKVSGAKYWGVALVVNNLTNRRYLTSVNYSAAELGSPFATINPPRFIAVELHAGI